VNTAYTAFSPFFRYTPQHLPSHANPIGFHAPARLNRISGSFESPLPSAALHRHPTCDTQLGPDPHDYHGGHSAYFLACSQAGHHRHHSLPAVIKLPSSLHASKPKKPTAWLAVIQGQPHSRLVRIPNLLLSPSGYYGRSPGYGYGSRYRYGLRLSSPTKSKLGSSEMERVPTGSSLLSPRPYTSKHFLPYILSPALAAQLSLIPTWVHGHAHRTNYPYHSHFHASSTTNFPPLPSCLCTEHVSWRSTHHPARQLPLEAQWIDD